MKMKNMHVVSRRLCGDDGWLLIKNWPCGETVWWRGVPCLSRDRPPSTDLNVPRPIDVSGRQTHTSSFFYAGSGTRAGAEWWQGKYAAIEKARWQAPLKSHSNSSSSQFVKRTRKRKSNSLFFFCPTFSKLMRTFHTVGWQISVLRGLRV